MEKKRIIKNANIAASCYLTNKRNLSAPRLKVHSRGRKKYMNGKNVLLGVM